MRNRPGIFFALTCSMALGQSALQGSTAQNPKIEQLLQELENTPLDTHRAMIMADLSWEYIGIGSYEQALKCAHEGVAIAKELRFDRGEARCLNNIGVTYKQMGDLTKALEVYGSALMVLERMDFKRGIATTLFNMGVVHFEQGNAAKAMQHYTRSLVIHEQMGDKEGMSRVLNGIGILYKNQGETPKAIDYYTQSLRLREERGDRHGIANSLINIGGIHFDNDDFAKANDNLTQCLEIFEELGDKRGIGFATMNLAAIQIGLGNLDQALMYHNRSLAIHEEIGDKYGTSSALQGISSVHLNKGDFRNSIHYGNKALRLAHTIGAPSLIRDAAKTLWQSYKGIKKSDSALFVYELYIQTRDSIDSEENIKEVMHQQIKYDYDKKEALQAAEQEKKDALAAEELRRKNQQRNAFIGGFVLMLGLAGVSYRSYRRKKADNLIIAKEKARSEELLLNILPEEVAEELKATGEAEARLIEHVTVLFTDFKGFTAMSEKVTPKELVKDLHECFSAFDRICEQHGIEKIKTIGDAYMAAGGLPTPNTTHAHDVVRAALEMAKVVEEGKARKIAAGLPFFEIRIGIHTGPVVAGIVGIKKFQYDIWGDTVNTASRMESSGEVGKVNISEATYALVKDDFTCEYRGEVEAKGKGKMGMWFASVRRPG